MTSLSSLTVLAWTVIAQPGTGGPSAPPAGPANPAPAPGGGGASGGASVQELFMQSFDAFTVVLLVCSVLAVAVIARCVLEIRPGVILAPDSERRLRQLIRDQRWAELSAFAERDNSFPGRVVHAALSAPGRDKDTMRDAAELAASEQCANLFRRIEPLHVIGTLGPLLGLAGTVWGMVLAFTELGQAGGQASPVALSAGIAKALFHTLLGLVLAIPALAAFGVYRSVVDRVCNRGMALSTELFDMLPANMPRAAGEKQG